MLPEIVEVAPANWVTVTSAQIVNDRAVVLYGVEIYAEGADDVISLYDGQNTNAPLVFSVHVTADRSKNIVINRGLLLMHGLYIGGVLSTTTVTVAWRPYEEPIIPSGIKPGAKGR